MAANQEISKLDASLKPLLERFDRYHRSAYTQDEQVCALGMLMDAEEQLPQKYRDHRKRASLAHKFLGGHKVPKRDRKWMLAAFTAWDEKLKEVELRTGESMIYDLDRPLCHGPAGHGYEHREVDGHDDEAGLTHERATTPRADTRVMLEKFQRLLHDKDTEDCLTLDPFDDAFDDLETASDKVKAAYEARLYREVLESVPVEWPNIASDALTMLKTADRHPISGDKTIAELFKIFERKMERLAEFYAQQRALRRAWRGVAQEKQAAVEEAQEQEAAEKHAAAAEAQEREDVEITVQLRSAIKEMSMLELGQSNSDSNIAHRRLRQAVTRLPPELKEAYGKQEASIDFRDFVLGKRLSFEKRQAMHNLYSRLLLERREVVKEAEERKAEGKKSTNALLEANGIYIPGEDVE